MQCDRCAGEAFTKAGRDRLGRQLWCCQACSRRLTTRSASAFSGYRFPDEIITLAVRWYLRFRLSYADVAEWVAERGITVDPSTIYDWVHAFTPRFIDVTRQHRHPKGRSERSTPRSGVDGERSRGIIQAGDRSTRTSATRPLDRGASGSDGLGSAGWGWRGGRAPRQLTRPT